MPNGAPGDHPYIDIVSHGRSVYRPDIDELVREIDRSGSEDLKVRAMRFLWENHNPWSGKPVDHDLVLSELKRLRAEPLP
jgi:hypothetical protein